MSKEDVIKVKGVVTNVLPSTTFEVKLEQGNSILCHISGKIRKNNITILLGDYVDVEMSVYDLTKGRITFRHKK